MRALFITILLLLFTSICSAYDAKIIKYFGDVEVMPYSKSTTPAKEGMELFEKDTIRTGDNGWVALELNDKSRINLGNKTQVTIYKDKNKLEIQLDRGKLKAKVKKVKDREVTFKTSTAVAGIRGTEFTLFNENNANIFFGKEGIVEVKGTREGKELLSKEEMTETTKGNKPIPPQKVEPNTPLEEAEKLLSMITADTPPEDFKKAEGFPEIIARWNVNFSRYLVDKKEYEEALHVLQIALDISRSPELRSDARLQRGNIYSVFLDAYEDALAEHLLNLEEYPSLPQAEISLYQAAMLLYELGFKEQATLRFKEYKEKYPNGRYINNVERYLK